MDKTPFAGLVIFLLIVAAVALTFFNDPNTKMGITNPIISSDNQSKANNSTTQPDINTQYTSSGPLKVYISPKSSHGHGSAQDSMVQIIDLFDAYAKSIFSQSDVPGSAIVIIQNDKIIYQRCFGVRDIASGAPVTPDTLFEIGSTSKAFSALNVAQQVDKGLMGWDDPAIKYYNSDEFQLYDPGITNTITLRDLLLMRSGMPTQGGSACFSLFNDPYPEILYKFRYLANDTPFRSKWQYNNVLYCLPAYSAARVNHKSWQELIKTDLLDPLGMKTTTTNYHAYLKSPNHATSYIKIFNGTLMPFHMANLDSVGPSGSIGSSITEMAHWLKFQIADTGIYNGQRIVSKANFDLTHTGQIDIPGLPAKFGLGWAIKKDFIGADGSTQSSQTKVAMIPSKKIGMVILTNQGPYGAEFHQALYTKLTDLLKGIKNTDTWPEKKKTTDAKTLFQLPEHPLPPQKLPTYLGKYKNLFYGTIKISSNKKTLVLYFGNNQKPSTLVHWDNNTFLDPSGGSFTFTDITNGKAKTLITSLPDYKDPNQPPKANATFNRAPNP